MTDEENFKPAAAIFDMDGLMLDTERPAIALWIKAGKTYGYTISEEIVLLTLGVSDDGIRALCERQYGRDFPFDKILEERNRLITEEFAKEGIVCRPGLIVLLDHLASLKIPVAVATSTHRETAVWKLRKAGVLDRFTVMVCGDEITRGKPAPDIFLLAAERLGRPPSVCVGFEDSPAGLRGLHDAGIRSVFVKDLVEPPEEILSTVWRRCGDLAEAAKFFG